MANRLAALCILINYTSVVFKLSPRSLRNVRFEGNLIANAGRRVLLAGDGKSPACHAYV